MRIHHYNFLQFTPSQVNNLFNNNSHVPKQQQYQHWYSLSTMTSLTQLLFTLILLLAWTTLRAAYHGGDQSQILSLTGQLQTMRLAEGTSIEEYIKKARETKNKLVSMGETFSD
jgi:hypothetical protein